VENILSQSVYIGIIATGMTFVLLTGGIDLSVGANMFLSASVASGRTPAPPARPPRSASGAS
jgi:ribose/xylose/arabinose/galactoside ABC-type transport system permease subunit